MQTPLPSASSLLAMDDKQFTQELSRHSIDNFFNQAVFHARASSSSFELHYSHDLLREPVLHKFKHFFLTDDVLSLISSIKFNHNALREEVSKLINPFGIREYKDVMSAKGIVFSLLRTVPYDD
jgi:hypothetical protein